MFCPSSLLTLCILENVRALRDLAVRTESLECAATPVSEERLARRGTTVAWAFLARTERMEWLARLAKMAKTGRLAPMGKRARTGRFSNPMPFKEPQALTKTSRHQDDVAEKTGVQLP